MIFWDKNEITCTIFGRFSFDGNYTTAGKHK
jgi:hypothetical protein